MGMSSSYNFRNPVRHFIDIDHLEYPHPTRGSGTVNKV